MEKTGINASDLFAGCGGLFYHRKSPLPRPGSLESKVINARKTAQTFYYFRHMTIAELEAWFKTVEMPAAPILLNPSTKINDIKQFLDSHFYSLKIDPNSKINQPILDRLLDFKLLIESNLEKK